MSNEQSWPDNVYLRTRIQNIEAVHEGICSLARGNAVPYTRADLLAEQDKQILDALELGYGAYLTLCDVLRSVNTCPQLEAAIQILSERLK